MRTTGMTSFIDGSIGNYWDINPIIGVAYSNSAATATFTATWETDDEAELSTEHDGTITFTGLNVDIEAPWCMTVIAIPLDSENKFTFGALDTVDFGDEPVVEVPAESRLLTPQQISSPADYEVVSWGDEGGVIKFKKPVNSDTLTSS